MNTSWNMRVTFARGALVASALSLCVAAAGACKSNNIASTTNNDGTVIGAAGGIVAGPDNAEIRIPAGALKVDTKFTIAVAEPNAYPPLGSPYNFDGKVYAFLPHGTKFLTPVVVSLPHTDGTPGVVGLHADPNGSWTEATATNTADAVEISTSSLSFYAVASKGGDGGLPTATCSGRSPDNSAPRATTVSGMSGTIAASGPFPAVDLSGMVDGYAVLNPQGQQGLFLYFTPYQQACGYYANGISKIGVFYGLVLVRSQTGITTRTYTGNEIDANAQGTPPNAKPGACGSSGNGGGPSPSTGTGVTISAIDANHVAGSFSFTPPAGGGQLSGTFDLPLCSVHPGLNPSQCCIP